jgi:UDP-N-acetyl-D-glucosamine dehydrogenase
VSYTDPYVPELKLDGRTLSSVDLPKALASRPDCGVICTDHSVFDYQAVVDSGTLLVDTRNALRQFTGPKIFRL